jgi:hypothetical protein
MNPDTDFIEKGLQNAERRVRRRKQSRDMMRTSKPDIRPEPTKEMSEMAFMAKPLTKKDKMLMRMEKFKPFDKISAVPKYRTTN